MVLYQICVFGADLKSNMAARVHNVFSLAEILKIFLSETTKEIKPRGELSGHQYTSINTNSNKSSQIKPRGELSGHQYTSINTNSNKSPQIKPRGELSGHQYTELKQ